MTRWRALRVLGVLALLVTSGCWLQGGFDARRSGFNLGEPAIPPDNVNQLAPAWTAPVGGAPVEPILFDGTAFVRADGAITALSVADGSRLWTTGVAGTGLPVMAD